MGFFKKLIFGAVAVVAAPVVLPAAGAAAVAAAGAAAAGAAGAVGAAGAAAAGAVGAAATAAAGTTVGAAAVGAMGAVGGAVGTAAGAVGLTSVATAAGSTAGAAAVGTIATSTAIGGVQAASAVSKLSEAKNIKAKAQVDYENAYERHKKKVTTANASFEKLADCKKVIAEKLNEFNRIFKRIKNPSAFGDIEITTPEAKGAQPLEWKAYTISLKELTKGVLSSYAAGEIAGVALTSGISTTITAASTGTAMATLSGAAYTNAQLAALGGGTLAQGGLGVAGGAIVSSALAAAPAILFGGILLNSKGAEALKQAKKIRKETNAYKKNTGKINTYLTALTARSDEMGRNIQETLDVYKPRLKKLHHVIYTLGHDDAREMTGEEKILFFATLNLALVLQEQLKFSLVKVKEAESEEVSYDVNNIVATEEVTSCSVYNDDLTSIKSIKRPLSKLIKDTEGAIA